MVKVQGQGHPSRSKLKKQNQGKELALKREIIFKPAKRYIEMLYMKPYNWSIIKMTFYGQAKHTMILLGIQVS